MAQNPNLSHLGQGQIVNRVFDPINDRIRVDTEANVTVAGDLEVSITHLDDSVKIGDGTDFLAVNSDGSINVNVTATSSGNEEVVSEFNQISAVASGINTTLQTYTVPALTTAYLKRVELSGSNIAVFEIYIDGVINGRKRTFFGAPLNCSFEYSADSNKGLLLLTGTLITLKVLHNRPSLGDFESRLQMILTT